MNKQDKKEIMNLIKYKKMLGGRRMYINQRVYVPSANMEGIIKKINGRDLTIKLDCGLTIETDKREVVIAIADMFHNEEVEE